MLLQMARFPSLYGRIISHCVCVCMYLCVCVSSSIHPSVGTGCLYILAIVDGAAMIMECVYLFKLMFLFPLDRFPKVKLLVAPFFKSSEVKPMHHQSGN